MIQKKIENTGHKGGTDQHKIWCDEREAFQYVKACESNCKKKNRCKALRDYREPRLY
jgi:hypothetical protein